MSKKILVIGSSNVDLIMQMERIPRIGETLTNGTFSQTYGGKGANQAVAAARAGGSVDFISALGQDSFAPEIIANFE
ncbi:MAG: PfkB family carbohydrate kinase, partial [Bacteroidota bacterium]